LAFSPTEHSQRAVWIGWAVLAALVAIVAAVLIQARSQPAAGAGAVRYSPPSGDDLKGFQPEAWFLPADELLGFVEIPAGPFLMGSDPARDPLAYDNERWPGTAGQATVDLPAFFIGRYEVTVAQFGAFVDATGHRVDERTLRAPANHPVVMITWPDALAYCRWLEEQVKSSTKTPPRLQALLREGWRVGLPSEAQWEKAGRGADGRIYPWGNELRRDRANFGRAAAAPVGSIPCPECAFGLSDMSGNVWEWTRSPYQPYPYDPSDDRKNLEADALWVMRGGSFADAERNVRAAIRGGADPGARRPFIGFRLALYRAEGTGQRAQD
jgi:formylglycine-generating enzyme required for sulfatase activity